MISLPAKGPAVIVTQFPYDDSIVYYLNVSQHSCLFYELQENIYTDIGIVWLLTNGLKSTPKTAVFQRQQQLKNILESSSYALAVNYIKLWRSVPWEFRDGEKLP
jgi:hypothetical protein